MVKPFGSNFHVREYLMNYHQGFLCEKKECHAQLSIWNLLMGQKLDVHQLEIFTARVTCEFTVTDMGL